MRYLRLLALLTVPLALVASASRARAQTTATLKLPFPAGTTWKAVQGYNGGTHVPGPEQFALDLVRDGDGPTAGAEVLAPASGSIWYMNVPGTGNGCLSIKIDGGGGLIVEMCHMVARPFHVDDRVEMGQPVGTIGAAGTLGNNGLAHLHLSMHRTPDLGITRIPMPFALPDGLPLDGISLPPNGTYNQYGCPGSTCRGPFVSTNGRAGSGAPATTVPVPAAAPFTPATPAPAPMTAASAPAPAAMGALTVGVAARVSGAGDCLNVHEAPGLSARVLACLPDGTVASIVQGPLTADGHTWWRLDGQGWAVADYLAYVSGPAIRPGAAVVVATDDGSCLNLRAGPGIAAQVIACLPNGTRSTVTGGSIDADGHTWWQLDGQGWAVGDYLRLAGGS